MEPATEASEETESIKHYVPRRITQLSPERMLVWLKKIEKKEEPANLNPVILLRNKDFLDSVLLALENENGKNANREKPTIDCQRDLSLLRLVLSDFGQYSPEKAREELRGYKHSVIMLVRAAKGEPYLIQSDWLEKTTSFYQALCDAISCRGETF